jgi:hypothetical protein
VDIAASTLRMFWRSERGSQSLLRNSSSMAPRMRSTA